MKYKSKSIVDKSILISMFFICVSIYLPPFFKSLSITFLSLSIILAYLTKSYSFNFNFNKHNFLILILYILYVIGVFYSSDIKEALFDLEVKLPIIIFPVLFFFLPRKFISKRNIWLYCSTIIAGLVINILYCFGYGILNSINNSLPLIPEISYTKLSHSFHPSYLSLFASIALIFVYKIPFKNLFNFNTRKNVIVKFLLYFIITIFLLMLKSRSGFIAMTISYVWIICNTFFVEKRKLVSIFTFILIAFFYIVVFNSSQFSVRYYNAIENMSESNTTSVYNTNSMSQRKFIYSNCIDLIFKNPIFGVGTGDVKLTLQKLYKDQHFYFKSYLNAHCQFIQTTIALGAIGFIVLIIIFLLPIIEMYKQKEYFLVTIFVLIGVSFLFESVLERQMGTFFFGLIYVLSNSYLEKDIEISKE